METFNPDPKPGRVVLPLVLIGMIATTYTFINRVSTNNDLDIVAEETPVETIAEEVVVEDTSTTSTTTTLPDDYVQHGSRSQIFKHIGLDTDSITQIVKNLIELD